MGALDDLADAVERELGHHEMLSRVEVIQENAISQLTEISGVS